MPAPRALKGREGRSRPDLRGSQRHQRAPNTAWISTNVMAYPRAAAEALPSTDSISVTTSDGRVPFTPRGVRRQAPFQRRWRISMGRTRRCRCDRLRRARDGPGQARASLPRTGTETWRVAISGRSILKEARATRAEPGAKIYPTGGVPLPARNASPATTPAVSPARDGEPKEPDKSTRFVKVVPRGGIEPPTLRFSVACSTN